MRKARKFVPAALVVALVIFFHDIAIPTSSEAGHKLLDSLHAPAFGLLALTMAYTLRKRFAPARAYAYAAGTILMLGLVSEISQYFGPRDADLPDLVHDAIGIAGFLGMYALVDHDVRTRLSRARSMLLRTGAGGLTLVAIAPLIWFSYVFLARANAMPELCSFENHWEREFVQPQYNAIMQLLKPPVGWPAPNQRRVAKVTLSGGEYPGIILHPTPDWRGYSYFSFLMASAGDVAFDVTIRINDSAHNDKLDDRFNRTLGAEPTPRRIRFRIDDILQTPSGRRMDPAAITTVIVFAMGDSRGQQLLIDDFRLEGNVDR